jgi:hypothetical protein
MKIKWDFVFDTASTWIAMVIVENALAYGVLYLMTLHPQTDMRALMIISILTSLFLSVLFIPFMVIQFPWLLEKQKRLDKNEEV